jgi:hypothetical protein
VRIVLLATTESVMVAEKMSLSEVGGNEEETSRWFAFSGDTMNTTVEELNASRKGCAARLAVWDKTAGLLLVTASEAGVADSVAELCGELGEENRDGLSV